MKTGLGGPTGREFMLQRCASIISKPFAGDVISPFMSGETATRGLRVVAPR
jgi:hypothetical protein